MEYVTQQTCQLIHKDADKLCDEKHKTIAEKLDSVSNWQKGLVAAVVLEIVAIGANMLMGK